MFGVVATIAKMYDFEYDKPMRRARKMMDNNKKFDYGHT